MIDRVKNILLSPKTEWPVIAGETTSVQAMYVGYILILAAIGPIAMGIRFGLIGFAIVSYLIGLVMVYLVALIADFLAPSFGGEKNFIRALQLVAYAFTAAWVGGVFHLLPLVGSLLTLVASIYSLYLLYLGAPAMRKCAPEKAVGYTVVLVICAIVAGAILSWIFFSIAPVGPDVMGPAMMMR